jgi:hypothetical protein
VGGAYGTHGKVYRVLAGKPEGKRPLEKPRRRWESGIRMDLRQIGWWSVEWMQLTRDRDRWRVLVNTVMKLRVLTTRSYILLSSWRRVRTDDESSKHL